MEGLGLSLDGAWKDRFRLRRMSPRETRCLMNHRKAQELTHVPANVMPNRHALALRWAQTRKPQSKPVQLSTRNSGQA